MWNVLFHLYHEVKDWAGILLPVLIPYLHDWYKEQKRLKSERRRKSHRLSA